MKKRKRVFCKKMFAAMLTASMLTTSSGGIEIAQAASKNEAVIANEDEIQNSSAYGKQSMTDELSGEIAESKRVDRRRSKVLTEDKTDIKSEPKRKTIKKSTKGVRKASAGEITSGDYTLKISGNDATITKYNGNATSGSLLLPTQLDGYTIVEIGNEAFKGKNISGVIIAPTIKKIGTYAFADCDSLGEVKFTENNANGYAVSIGGGAFQNCKSLSTVEFSRNVTEIEWHAFEGCSELSELVLPACLKNLGWCAFRETYLSYIKIPKTLTTCGSYNGDGPFSGAEQLTHTSQPDIMPKLRF